MDFQSRQENNVTVVTVSGRMDALTAPVFQDRMSGLIAVGDTVLVVDLALLEYISSAGLRSILTIAKALKSKGGQLIFVNVTGTVRDVFDMSGFGTIFPMHGSLADALGVLG